MEKLGARDFTRACGYRRIATGLMKRMHAARVAILGAESTGKSTLADALAVRYQTLWVPEYLREFVDTHQRVPLEHEQFLIAATQVEREDAVARQASRFLFCDTTPLMTAIYSDFYFGRVDDPLAALARQRAYDFTIVTAPDSPWIEDGLQRESEVVRQVIHARLLAVLEEMGIAYMQLEGGLAQRIERAVRFLETS
jgi:NadR type nicotinamide-nucleotide adenylyltransferase